MISANNHRKTGSVICPAHAGIINHAVEMQGTVNWRQPDCYMANFLVQTTLPHSNTDDKPGAHFSRSNRLIRLTISPTSPRFGIPYGPIPRLILAWLCTEVKKTKSQVIDIGKNQTEWMKKIGLNSKDTGTIERFKDQAMRLFCCAISLERLDQIPRASSQRLLVTDSLDILWDPIDPQKGAPWKNTITVSDGFYRAICRSSVPLKFSVYRKLTRSPLAMDIYLWTIYRTYTLNRSQRKQAEIPWEQLMNQLGSDYSGPTKRQLKDFKSNFKKQLRKVAAYYPELHDLVSDSADDKCIVIQAAVLIHPKPAVTGSG